MPSSKRSKPRPKSPARRPAKSRPPASRPTPRPSAGAKAKKPERGPEKKAGKAPVPSAGKSAPKGSSSSTAPKAPEPVLKVPLPGGREHVLSLAFVRDGDEFLARLETDAGQITELKNRSLDQLLTLVASELEDLLE
jgi:hypothetical protein